MGESAVSGLKSFRVEKATLKAGLLLSAQSIVFLFWWLYGDERGKNAYPKTICIKSVYMQYTDQKHWFNFLAFLRKCLDPGVPKNGFRVGEDFSYKETVEYFCDPGFKLTEGTRFRSCQKNSKWNGTLPTCKGLLNRSEPYANHCDTNKFS